MASNKKKASSTNKKSLQESLTFACHPKYLAQVRRLVSKIWKQDRLPEREGRLVALAVDEALSAIVRHAIGTKRPGNIDVVIHIDDVRFKAVITDNTNGNHINYTDPKVVKNERQYQMGVYLISAIMDEVEYSYRKGFQNELSLIKFINI
ncbi:MAG: ATP-binding protein [Candidatus Brocadiia bacterium]